MDNNSPTIVSRPPSSTDSVSTDEPSKNPILSTRNHLKLVFPFNIPPTHEESSARIVTNLNYYKIYYAVFVWSILFIALLPQRKVSLILLVAMTKLTSLYLVFLRWFPNSHHIIDKRLVLLFLFLGTMVGMILTEAAVHFFVTLVGASPVILAHALFRVRYSLFANEQSCVDGGLVPVVYFVPFVHEKIDNYEPIATV